MQQAIIGKGEARERVRGMLASEVGQETLRYLVEKYITKPPKEKAGVKLEGMESDEDEE